MREVSTSMNQLGVKSAIYSTDVSPSPTLLSAIGTAAILGRRAVKDGFDALVFHKGHGASLFFRRNRKICYFHQVKYDDLIDGNILRSVYKNLLAMIERHIDYAVCNSAYVASRIEALMPQRKVHVVYPGARIPPVHRLMPSTEGFCYYHSRIHPRKNQDFLLKVFETLPFDLYLTGGTWDRPFQDYHRKIARRAGSMSNVRLTTDVSQSTHLGLLARCSVFLFPAKLEPFGMVLLDAMCLGKPIIALNSGASQEVLGEAGVLCSPNIEDWRSTISDVLMNPKMRLSLSRISLARVSQFSWGKTAKELIGILENT